MENTLETMLGILKHFITVDFCDEDCLKPMLAEIDAISQRIPPEDFEKIEVFIWDNVVPFALYANELFDNPETSLFEAFDMVLQLDATLEILFAELIGKN